MNIDKYKQCLNPEQVSGVVHEKDNLAKILATQEKIQSNSCKTIAFSSPIITYNETGIIFPNTINIIQGKKGVHKSRLTEIFCGLMLQRDITQSSHRFLGMKRNAMQKSVVLYVDTERNINDQFPYAIQKIKLLSGYSIEDKPENLDYISLIDIPRSERFDTLNEYIKRFRTRYELYNLFIVFDVVTDCVENFNDVRESLRLVDMLNETINTYNVTFLCVIHENPSAGNDKGRGHLGTELNNKASQVIQIGFEKDNQGNDTDLIRLKFLHSRNTKRLDPIYVQYSEESKGLVLASSDFINEKLAMKKSKAQIADIQNWLTDNLKEPKSKKELIEMITEAFDCGSRIVEDRLKELDDKGFIERFTVGKSAHYKLIIPF